MNLEVIYYMKLKVLESNLLFPRMGGNLLNETESASIKLTISRGVYY